MWHGSSLVTFYKINGVLYVPFASHGLTGHCPEVILPSWNQAFSQDLKSGRQKCTTGLAEMNNYNSTYEK